MGLGGAVQGRNDQPGSDGDRSTCGSKLECVTREVSDNLAKPVLVAENNPIVLGYSCPDLLFIVTRRREEGPPSDLSFACYHHGPNET